MKNKNLSKVVTIIEIVENVVCLMEEKDSWKIMYRELAKEYNELVKEK